MSDIKLNAQSRQEDFKRSQNEIPAVIYGPKSKNQNLVIDYKNFEKAYKLVGDSTLIDLSIDDKDSIKVLVHAVQHNPLDGNYIHVDFYQLDMTQKTQVEVTIKLLGLEQAEKSTGGEAVINSDKVTVECLPKDLVKEIEFDASEFLKEINGAVHAKNINLPEGLELITDGDAPIVTLREIKEIIIEETPSEEATEDEETTEGENKEESGDKTEDGNESKSEDKPEGKKDKK